MKLINLTSTIQNNIDHIVLSQKFVEGKKTTIKIFNEDKKLSNHLGICIEIEKG